MTITREQAIKEIIHIGSCHKVEHDRYGAPLLVDYTDNTIMALKALGVTEEEIENATK